MRYLLLFLLGIGIACADPVDGFTVTTFPFRGALVTPSDTTDLAVAGIVRADSAGAVVVVCKGNAPAETITVTLIAGEAVPCVVRRVKSTGTTVATLHIFY